MPLVKSFTLTVPAVATQLSTVYAADPNVPQSGPTSFAALDIPYRQLLLQAETADVKLGDNNVTASNYGTLVPFTASVVVTIGPWETGPIKLSEIWAISGGTGKLHILGIPY